ncbi:MAG: hydrogenase maturation protease [Gammaproteobacteria bacterium]|nr:hydrogenase maturation protease [Gammaproteobacteria bacterium]
MTDRAPILVLGIGNELFADEGLGVQAARRIEAMQLDGVDVLDGGTLGMALLPELEGRDAVLILDAVITTEGPPGTVIRLRGNELDRPVQMLFSAHQFGIGETIAAARLVGKAPDVLTAVGMVPFSLETGYGLSPEADGALAGMVEEALDVLTGWGVDA